MTKSSLLQIDVGEYLADEDFILMSLPARGLYFTLMLHCWANGSIPVDQKRLSRLCGMDSSAIAELWEELSSKFTQQEDRYILCDLERSRLQQHEFSIERQESGRRGALKRWENVKGQQTEELADDSDNDKSPASKQQAEDGIAIAELLAEPSSELEIAIPAPSPLLSSTTTSKGETGAERGVRGESVKRAARKPTQCDDEYLDSLQANPAYEGLDVKFIFHKMVAWCDVKGKQPTRSRLVNWLNREERPMQRSNGNGSHSPMTTPKTAGNIAAVEAFIAGGTKGDQR